MVEENIKWWLFRERVGKLVRGRGRYIDDIVIDGMLYCAILTSPHPHAVIKSIDGSKALKLPKVRKVLTGRELVSLIEPMPMMADYSEMGLLWRNPRAYPLAVDRVRFMGEPVAVVVAEDKYSAADALEHIQVSYEPLPSVTDITSALRKDAPLLYPEWGSNIQCRFSFRTPNVAEVFSKADRIVKIKWREGRQSGFPLETRGAIAIYDDVNDSYLVYSSTQSPTIARLEM